MNKPSKAAMMLSAFMAPGAGQFLQRRWTAGSLFLAAFLLCFIVLLVEILRPMVANILISIEWAARNTKAPLVEFRTARILGWLGASLGVYLTGLFDTWAAHRRQGREWARQHSRLRAPPMPKEPCVGPMP